MTGKRKNRARFQCLECSLVINADQKSTHQVTKHGGKTVKFSIFTGDSKQRKLEFNQPSSSKPVSDKINLVVSLKL